MHPPFAFKTSDNQVEYETIIVDLRQVENHSAHQVQLLSDSYSAINQIKGEFKVKQE